MSELHVVTGAFGFTGRYVTKRLLAADIAVRTITGNPQRANPFGPRLSVAPFNFDEPGKLIESLRGATTLYNTYWVRFPYGRTTYEGAVRNTLTMIRAAEAAGVRRMVHVSITNPSEDSPFRYFSGKAEIERAIRESSLSHAIIRPAVLFGSEDVLINNIAWLVRRFPVFVVPGSGKYRLQPIFVEDLADLMVSAAGRETDETFDACGADVFTFNELVHLIGSAVGRRPRLLHLPPAVALAASRIIGLGLRDFVLTRDEIDGLMADLLVSAAPPTGKTRLGGWLRAHADTAGKAYARELQRHFR